MFRNWTKPPALLSGAVCRGVWHPWLCPLPTSRAVCDLGSPSLLPGLTPRETEAQGQVAGLSPEAGPRSPRASTCRPWGHHFSLTPLTEAHGLWCIPACGHSAASCAKGRLPSSQLVTGPGIHPRSPEKPSLVSPRSIFSFFGSLGGDFPSGRHCGWRAHQGEASACPDLARCPSFTPPSQTHLPTVSWCPGPPSCQDLRAA